jgi:hypothetical protein
MYGADHLEWNAVGAPKEKRQRGASHLAREPCGGRVPLGIGHGALRPVEVGDFTGGKHNQQTAITEAFQTRAKTPAILVP